MGTFEFMRVVHMRKHYKVLPVHSCYSHDMREKVTVRCSLTSLCYESELTLCMGHVRNHSSVLPEHKAFCSQSDKRRLKEGLCLHSAKVCLKEHNNILKKATFNSNQIRADLCVHHSISRHKIGKQSGT